MAGCIKHLKETSNLDTQRSFLRYINFIFGIAFIIVVQCSISSFKRQCDMQINKGQFCVALFKFLLSQVAFFQSYRLITAKSLTDNLKF